MLCRINKKEMCGRLTHRLTDTSWIDVYLIKLAISYGSCNISYIAGTALFITSALETKIKSCILNQRCNTSRLLLLLTPFMPYLPPEYNTAFCAFKTTTDIHQTWGVVDGTENQSVKVIIIQSYARRSSFLCLGLDLGIAWIRME